MPSYRYQYKQQCCAPGVVRHVTPVFTQCHHPCAVRHVPCAQCASQSARLCSVRKTIQSIPRCPSPCSSGCVETHTMEGHSSSCSTGSPHPCTVVIPQHQVQGGGNVCVPQCRQQSPVRCPQMCAPAHVYQPSSYPYSYQWCNSYHYNCGQQ